MRRASAVVMIVALLALIGWLLTRGRTHGSTAEETAPPPSPHPAARPDPTPAQVSPASDGPPAIDPEPQQPAEPAPAATSTAGPPTDLDAPAEAGPLPEVLLDPRLIVRKQARTLDIVSDGTTVKRYPIALGSSPTGDKQREGDGRTPEGVFYVCTKNPKSRHTAALGLSYPSLEHAERGLEDGLITKRQFRVIAEALRHYERPTWSTPLGGEIMIHGGGTEADWTQGCIALNDDDALELYNALPMGTSVEILD